MPRRTLAIGLGGTGKACLTILKERLEETYGRVPDNVVLLSIDTDGLRKQDAFAGTQLTPVEYLHVVTPAGWTMDTVFADIVNGRTVAYMDWLEREKLDRIIGPGERDIRSGAQQRRPVGRVALMLSWSTIYNSIVSAIARMYGDPEEEQPVDTRELERSKRQIFIVGSVAGGTGSGFVIDIANLVRFAVWSNSNWRSVDVSGVIVLPDAFQSYTTLMDDPTNLKPNSYAALRELDRFMRTHGTNLPYMIRYGQDLRSTTWSTNQLLDHVYLVDTASRAATGEQDLAGDPMRGAFPVVADFIMAHVDNSLGNALATLRSNAGQHYSKEDGWQYSGFNIKTYIFPVDDVVESFSYRFLREMFARQYLPLQDKTTQKQVETEASTATISMFSQGSVGGKVNPALVQKAIAATRPVDPEKPSVSWQGLFNMIALSEGSFAEDLQDTEGWLVYLRGSLQPSKQGEYKNEGFDDGYVRLMNFSENFLDEVLGPHIDPDDEESRMGGEWDKILARYRDALRQRFSEALDAGLLEVLNARDPNSKIFLPARLPYARAMTATLKKTLVQFKAVLQNEYRKENIDTRIRNTSTELRNAIVAMQQTRDARGGLFGSRAVGDARRAQSSFIGLFWEKMELSLHQRVYRTVIDVIDALGAEEKDRDNAESVVDVAALELENWQTTLQEVDKLLADRSREHEVNRDAKRRVRVRRYLTDAEYEKQLYADPRHSGTVGVRVLGQVRGDKGMIWERKEPTEPLQFKMVTVWTEEASGPEEIADRFFRGMKDLFQVVCENVSVGDRVAVEFKSPATFVNKVNEVSDPFLRYNPALNGKEMLSERYVSFNLKSADEQSQKMLCSADATLASQREGYNVDTEAESLVACTVVQVARGVSLTAVDQFRACETDYRTKLFKGRESLHLFTEEQVATDYEGRIDVLGEPDNKQRALAPELVITMGDEAKLKVFTLACAYGMVEPGSHWDPDTGLESTEVFLKLGGDWRMPLSRSKTVLEQDPRFTQVSANEQIARLYLNALQNFVLLITERRGVPSALSSSLVEDLQQRAVVLDHVENPFRLSLRQVNTAISDLLLALGPIEAEEPALQRREALNARRRVERYLQPFIRGWVASLKRSPAVRVRDMGTVMHLILQQEVNQLLERVKDLAPLAVFAYDSVLSIFANTGYRSDRAADLWVRSSEPPTSHFNADQINSLRQICVRFGQLLRCQISDPIFINGLAITEIDTSHFMEDILFERPGARISPRITLIFAGWKDFGSDEANVLQLSLQKYNHMQSIVLLVLFDNQDMLTHTRRTVVDKMRTGYGLDVVVIGRKEIEDLSDSPNPPQSLRELVLSRIDITRISPYNITGPVVSDLVFSGREGVLRTIVGQVRTNSFALVGGRRYGKTSILLRLYRLRLPAGGFRSVYHDCSTTPTYESFVNAVGDWSPMPDLVDPECFGELLEKPPMDKPMVLLLDEVDKLVPDDRSNNWRLFNLVRALVNSGRGQVVLSGERTLREALDDPKSPLFNLANDIALGPLDHQAVEELITRPMKQLGIEIAEEGAVVERIWDFTSGHPNVVQRLCHRLIDRLNREDIRRVTLNSVDAVIKDPAFQRDDFLIPFFEAATPLERLVALLMADDEDVRTLSSVRKVLEARCNLKPSASLVDSALQRLVVLRSILQRTPTGYQFAATAFPRVIAGTVTLEDMLEIWAEKYEEQNES